MATQPNSCRMQVRFPKAEVKVDPIRQPTVKEEMEAELADIMRQEAMLLSENRRGLDEYYGPGAMRFTREALKELQERRIKLVRWIEAD